jgi:hypothetical protein
MNRSFLSRNPYRLRPYFSNLGAMILSFFAVTVVKID